VRVWDAETGRALTEWLRVGSLVSSLCFDPSGQRIAVADQSHVARVWDLNEAPIPVSEPFFALTEAIAGTRLGARGNVELLRAGELEQQAREFSQTKADDFYHRLGRWFLSAPENRPASPF
jgi:hypothetical protein